MTKFIMIRIVLSSLTGITGHQVLFFVGQKYSTPTIASALVNLLPAFTFILALIFKLTRESERAGQAKILGIVLGVGGALLLSFYHGKLIPLGESSIHWSYAEKVERASTSAQTNLILGPFCVIASAIVWALWLVIQTDLSKSFPVPYTSTTYMCFFASIQCVIIALCFEHKASAWSLHDSIRLVASLYAGVVCTGLAYSLTSWTLESKGAVYVSAFSPLRLVITAAMSWALLREKLYVGTLIASVLIVCGLYSVLWGKKREINGMDSEEATIQETNTNK